MRSIFAQKQPRNMETRTPAPRTNPHTLARLLLRQLPPTRSITYNTAVPSAFPPPTTFPTYHHPSTTLISLTHSSSKLPIIVALLFFFSSQSHFHITAHPRFPPLPPHYVVIAFFVSSVVLSFRFISQALNHFKFSLQPPSYKTCHPPATLSDPSNFHTLMSWSPVSSMDTQRSRPSVSKHDIRYLIDDPSKPHTSTSKPSRGYSSRHHQSTPSPSPRRGSSRHFGSPVSTTHSTLFCKSCSYRASSSNDLQQHMRTHHKSKRPSHQCPLCGKTFAEKGNLNKHHKVAHLKQKDHKCSFCDRMFAFKDGLTRHISMVHLNQRPYECTECMCPTGPHPPDVPCTLKCGIRFKQKSHQRRHVLSVHQAGKRMDGFDRDLK